MFLTRSTFSYRDRVLIEKIKIQLPFQYEAVFQNSGCFIYFKGKSPRLLSSESNLQIQSQEAILLKCGNHFLDLMRETDDEQLEVIVFHLYPEILKKLYIQELPAIINGQSDNNRSQVIASSHVIAKFIDSLEFYFQNPSLVNDDLLELKIKELILLLLQSKQVDSVLELITELYSSKKIQIKEVVELHLFSNLKLDQLAKLCNLSLSSFKREFKKEFDDSPNNYMVGKKLEKAQKLLTLTDLSIAEIAYEIGFQDPLYFARVFKKKLNISPSNYRLEYKL